MRVAPIEDKIREQRLRWYGHVQRAAPDHIARSAVDMEVEGKLPSGRPKLRWDQTIKADLSELQLFAQDTLDKNKWRSRIRVAHPTTCESSQRGTTTSADSP